MRLSATRLTSIAQAGGGRTLIQRAIAILRRFGPDAHVYLPGVGMLNGLQAANYIDSAGTQQGAVDQPVGLVLDAAGSLGVELVVNGDFSAGVAGWSAIGGGSLSASGSLAVTGGAAYSGGRAAVATVSGKMYQISGYADKGTANANAKITFGGVEVGTTATSGTFTIYLVASGASTNIDLTISSAATTGTAYFDNISVREVTGIHAQQATTSAKPILRRGAVNLLTWSGDFGNAVWTKTNSTVLASKLREDSSLNGHTLTNAVAAAIGTVYTAAFLVKAAERGFALLGLNGGGVGANFASINLTTGVVVGANGTTTQSAVSVADGYWLVAVTAPAATAAVSQVADLRTSVDGLWANRVYQGDGTSGIYCGAIGLFAGTYTAAQIQALGGIPTTTTAPASTALGSYFWSFDGVNDSLSLGSVPFQISDDFWVVGVVSSAAVAGDQRFFGLRTGVNMILCGSNAGNIDFFLRDAASTSSRCLSVAGIVSGTPYVYGARRLAGTQTVRKDGLVRGTDSTALGASLISSGSIGYDNNSVYFTGGIYPVAFGKGAITDADLLLIEKMLGQMSGVTIP